MSAGVPFREKYFIALAFAAINLGIEIRDCFAIVPLPLTSLATLQPPIAHQTALGKSNKTMQGGLDPADRDPDAAGN
jgi:hypothetical protein